ncbi:MAG: hypothetical protein MJ072_01565, partial [Clostridia bacterium]|nr:hypothetical protein [Clostridia bacterium]
MAEVFELKKDLSFYEKLDNKKSPDDYVGRLSLWHGAERVLTDPAVFFRISSIYKDAGLYDLAVEYLYKYLDSVSDKVDVYSAYIALGNCYYYLNNIKVANFYFNRAFLLCGMINEEELDEEVADYFLKQEEEGGDIREDYRIVYPPEKVDFSDDIDEAKELIATGRIDEAFEILQEIPETSKYYPESRAEMSVAEFLRGNTEKGIDLSKKALHFDGENIYALCNLSSMYFVQGDFSVSREHYDRAMRITPQNNEEKLKDD